MAKPQAASREARIVALATMIESNTATPVDRGQPATGSELHLCVQAHQQLRSEGIRSRVEDLLTHFGLPAEHAAGEARSLIIKR